MNKALKYTQSVIDESEECGFFPVHDENIKSSLLFKEGTHEDLEPEVYQRHVDDLGASGVLT